MGNDREEERLPAEDTRIVQNKHGILLIRHRGGLNLPDFDAVAVAEAEGDVLHCYDVYCGAGQPLTYGK